MIAFDSNRRFARLSVLCPALALMLPAAAYATPITFTYAGTATGSINDVPFTNAGFTISAGGNTDSRVVTSWGFYVPNDWATISIAGSGVYHFITSTQSDYYPWNYGVGFVRSTGLDLYDGNNSPTLANWDMLTSIGPATGDMYLQQWTADYDPVMTDGGQLIVNGGTCLGTYQASVPEPSGLVLLIISVASLLTYTWRKRPAKNNPLAKVT